MVTLIICWVATEGRSCQSHNIKSLYGKLTYSCTRWDGQQRGLQSRKPEGLNDEGILSANAVLQVGDGGKEEEKPILGVCQGFDESRVEKKRPNGQVNITWKFKGQSMSQIRNSSRTDASSKLWSRCRSDCPVHV